MESELGHRDVRADLGDQRLEDGISLDPPEGNRQMSEHDEFRQEMAIPETFRLELPAGHPGNRPFSALLVALESVQTQIQVSIPDLRRVRAGESLDLDEVSALLARLNLLGAALHESCVHASGIHSALHECLHPEQ